MCVCVCVVFSFVLFFARLWLNLIELGEPEQIFSTYYMLEVTQLWLLPLVDVV